MNVQGFERVSAKAASESVSAGSVRTHSDFCRAVEADTKRRIEAMRAHAVQARQQAEASASAAAGAAGRALSAQAATTAASSSSSADGPMVPAASAGAGHSEQQVREAVVGVA